MGIQPLQAFVRIPISVTSWQGLFLKFRIRLSGTRSLYWESAFFTWRILLQLLASQTGRLLGALLPERTSVPGDFGKNTFRIRHSQLQSPSCLREISLFLQHPAGYSLPHEAPPLYF